MTRTARSAISSNDEALAWAERGLNAFPDRPHNDLRDFLVRAYLKRKRNDEALQLTWIQFEERPRLEVYKKLHEVAGKLGIWLRKIGGLMKAQNKSREFGNYLAELRVQFKPKRNFIKLLDDVARATAGTKSVL